MMKRKDHKTLYINGIKFIALGYMHILILIATVFLYLTKFFSHNFFIDTPHAKYYLIFCLNIDYGRFYYFKSQSLFYSVYLSMSPDVVISGCSIRFNNKTASAIFQFIRL